LTLEQVEATERARAAKEAERDAERAKEAERGPDPSNR
jgi:hypothetical protein